MWCACCFRLFIQSLIFFEGAMAEEEADAALWSALGVERVREAK